MKKFRHGILPLIVLTLMISPLSADIISSRPAEDPKPTPDALIQTLEQSGVEHSLAFQKLSMLTDTEAGYFSERPESIRIAGQQTEWYELWGGFLWFTAVVGGAAWYIANH